MNLVINKYCNLKCEYCFAKSIMNDSSLPDEMEKDNFLRCLEFLKVNNNKEIRLIGGEPTISDSFINFLNIIIDTNCFDKILVFTNGIIPRERLVEIVKLKNKIEIVFLINYNSSIDIGEAKYTLLSNSMKVFFDNKIHFDLGINLYSDNQDLSEFFDNIKLYKKRNVRWAVAAPSSSSHINNDPFSLHYKKILPKVEEFLRKCYLNRIKADIDCATIPVCLIEEKELRNLVMYAPQTFLQQKCMPSIDVLPDLSIVRCFGTSSLFKIHLNDYKNEKEISKSFIKKIDLKVINKEVKCNECNVFDKYKARCGCIAL